MPADSCVWSRSALPDGVLDSYAFEPANGMYTGTGVFVHRVERGRFRYIGMDGGEV